MKILQYFVQRRINKALMKALAAEVTAKLDDRELRLDIDAAVKKQIRISNDAYGGALANGMKRFAKPDNAEWHDDNAQYVQLSLDGSPLSDTELFGRPLSNAEVTARLDVTTSRITPEHPYVEFDDDMQQRLNASIFMIGSSIDLSRVSSLLRTEDALYIIELLEEVKRGLN